MAILVLSIFVLLALGSGSQEPAVKTDDKTFHQSDLADVASHFYNIPPRPTRFVDNDRSNSYFTIEERFITECYISGTHVGLRFSDSHVNPRLRGRWLQSPYLLLADLPNVDRVRLMVPWDDYFRLKYQHPELSIENLSYAKTTPWNKYKIYLIIQYHYAKNEPYYDYEPSILVQDIEGPLPDDDILIAHNQRELEIQAANEEARKREEAERRAFEERFIFKTSNFDPADYRRADLFEAVATSERLSATPDYFANIPVYDSMGFVSDVTFIRQDVTDITFRNLTGDVTRTMKITARSGLQNGQRVRIYYRVYRILPWEIIAIERL